MFASTQRESRDRFSAGLIAIAVLLFSSILLVPLIRQNESLWWLYIPTAIAAATAFHLRLKRYRKRKEIAQEEIPEEVFKVLEKKVPFYQKLSKKDKKVFAQRVAVFIAETTITGIEHKVDAETRVLVGASAVIPCWGFPQWEYDVLEEVLIYPGTFDKDYDTNNKKANFLGMVGEGGAMDHVLILSGPALLQGYQNSTDRLNVAIHEFAHLIDKADGSIDGVPAAFIAEKDRKFWFEVMRENMEEIKSRNSDINAYAAYSEAEFFAVTSEYFFEDPDGMQRKHPDLHKILSKVYHQEEKKKRKKKKEADEKAVLDSTN